jgi:hypothetical protein
MPRIQGLFEVGPLNGSLQVKAVEGYLFSITTSWKGLTVGDVVCQILDDTADNGAADKIVLTVYAATANGTWSREWAQGKRFSTGIFYKEGASGGPSGSILTELTAK